MFGEMALFFNQPRSADIRAKSFCDLFVLSRNDFIDVTNSFPYEKRIMQEVAEQRRLALGIQRDDDDDSF